MDKFLETLCLLPGISGDEGTVRTYIEEQIKGCGEYTVDNLGSLIVTKQGKKRPKQKIMLSAHVDEVGLIVTSIKSDGTLRVEAVGGIDSRVLLGRSVRVGKNLLPGVIGTKAVHQQSAEERGTAVGIDKLYVDLGTSSEAETRKLVSEGDSITFAPLFGELGNGYLQGKALDDRIGCAILISMLQSELEYDTTFVFCTQEEVGTRGSRAAAYSVAPDIGIVLEATTAGDLPGVSGGDKVCELGKGPVISFMDRGTVYDRELYRIAFEVAKENGIPCQTKTKVAGGNDAVAIQQAQGGVRMLALSAPCRYIHSPAGVISKTDVEAMQKLTNLLLSRLAEL